MKASYKTVLLKTLFLIFVLPFGVLAMEEIRHKKWLNKKLEEWRERPEVKAFLDLIAAAEGTDFRFIFVKKFPRIGSSKGYKIIFSGDTFESYKSHPDKVICAVMKGKEWCSSAAGRYQFLKKTWDKISEELGLRDFSPRNQDVAAIFLIWEKGAIKDILDRDFEKAINKLNTIWASFPGSPYGQPMYSMEKLSKFYDERLIYYKNLIGTLR